MAHATVGHILGIIGTMLLTMIIVFQRETSREEGVTKLTMNLITLHERIAIKGEKVWMVLLAGSQNLIAEQEEMVHTVIETCTDVEVIIK